MDKNPPESPERPSATPTAARLELTVLLLFAAVVTAVFWVTNLDLEAAAHFYHEDPGAKTPWPEEKAWFWQLLYKAAPALTGLLGFSGLGMMIAGALKNQWRHWRVRGLFILLVVILGPGLIVNAIFKDHWGRPRPREIVQFGGEREYVPPFQFGEHGVGKSFPCGHCSVAFAFAAFWFLLRRRHPRWAWGVLGASITAGALVGAARMAAGAHFLSDVLMAGVFAYLTAWLLYYPVMNVPLRLSAGAPKPARRRPLATAIAYSVLGSALLAGLLLATPIARDLSYTRIKAGSEPTVIHLNIDEADLRLRFIDAPAPAFDLNGQVRAFGLPTNNINESAGYEKEQGVPTIRYSLTRRGIFTEYEARLTILISSTNLDALHLSLKEGDVRYEAVSGRIPHEKLHLNVLSGEIIEEKRKPLTADAQPNPPSAGGAQAAGNGVDAQ